MKNKMYFPFEVNMTNKEREARLIEHCGPKGFGTYIIILTELRQSVNYQCSVDALKGMARRFKISTKMLKDVLYGFGLFTITSGEDGTEYITSAYMKRVMQAYNDRLEKLAKAGKKNADNSKRSSSGKFTIKDGALDKDKDKDKDNTTTSTTNVVEGESQQWQIYLDAAIKDEEWMALLAMNSGISALFAKHQAAVVEAFRQHVQLQGRGNEQQSVADVRAYFANFMRQGTPTQKRVAAQLEAIEEAGKQASPNRFETFDPETGQRSYYGNPIPACAPPRPTDNAVWSYELDGWI